MTWRLDELEKNRTGDDFREENELNQLLEVDNEGQKWEAGAEVDCGDVTGGALNKVELGSGAKRSQVEKSVVGEGSCPWIGFVSFPFFSQCEQSGSPGRAKTSPSAAIFMKLQSMRVEEEGEEKNDTFLLFFNLFFIK